MKHKQIGLQKKLFLAYTLLACIVLFSFAAFFYIFVSRLLIDRRIQSMDALNSGFLTQVDHELQNLDNVSININYSNISKNILDSSFNLTISDRMLSEMTDLFIVLNGSEWKADQMNLYDTSGHVLQAGLITMVKSTDGEEPEWFRQVRSSDISKIISPPYETERYSKSRQWFISLYRSFDNQYGRSVGAIEIVKQCKSIFKSIIFYKKKNKNIPTDIYVFDKEGHLVYPYNIDNETAADIEKYYLLTASVKSGSSFKSPLTGENEYAAFKASRYSGYTCMTIMSRDLILSPVYQLLGILVLVILIILITAAFISYRLSRSIVRPIKHLKHIIQRLEIDTLGEEKVTSFPVSVNELDELYRAFELMSNNMKESMNQLFEAKEQEMKSRTLALQTQINPHFYYNSLSSVIVLAESGQTDTIIKMCRNLSNIMRYITASNSIVTLREETDYVKKYLYCMKVRYQSSLNYNIDIDERLMSEKIPKLIIQPIVENAIKYGSDCEPPWNITVNGYILPDRWQIDVIDSGSGFTPEALALIDDNVEKARLNSGMPELKINGLGTVNVYLRWLLFCKDDIIFTYGNTPEGHGIVSIGRYFPKNVRKEGEQE